MRVPSTQLSPAVAMHFPAIHRLVLLLQSNPAGQYDPSEQTPLWLVAYNNGDIVHSNDKKYSTSIAIAAIMQFSFLAGLISYSTRSYKHSKTTYS